MGSSPMAIYLRDQWILEQTQWDGGEMAVGTVLP